MNSEAIEDYLKLSLDLKELEKEVCKYEVQSFKCCVAIKGLENCEDYFQYIRLCYKNSGRNVL